MTIPAESPQRLILKVNAETTVSIDGVAELSTSTGSTYLTSEKFFAPGTHKVDICFHSGTGYAQIYLGWKSEAEQIKLVPRSALSPYPPVQPTR
jgi:hypothetical protein